MNTVPRRFRMGDTCAKRPGLVFLSYNGRFEKWVTPEKLCELKAKVKSKEYREWANNNRKRPEVKAKRRSEYERAKKVGTLKMAEIVVRRKRGESHPTDPNLVFFCYQFGNERWVTIEALEQIRAELKIKNLDNLHRRMQDPTYRAEQTEKHRVFGKKHRKRLSAYAKRHRQENIEAKIASRLRTRIRDAVAGSGNRKLFKTADLIGCSISDLKAHIESQFIEGMSWERISEIEIDHILPVAMFRLEHESQQLLCFNFRNLRPMWAVGNHAKSDLIQHEGKTIRARELRGKILPFQTQAA